MTGDHNSPITHTDHATPPRAQPNQPTTTKIDFSYVALGLNPLRYATGTLDPSTGLTKLGLRYYNPTTGRFSQQDPSGQNPGYVYAGNSPTNSIDPSGADFLGISGCVGFGVSLCVNVGYNSGAGKFFGGGGVGFGVGGDLSLTRGSGSASGHYSGLSGCVPVVLGAGPCGGVGNTRGGPIQGNFGLGGGVGIFYTNGGNGYF